MPSGTKLMKENAAATGPENPKVGMSCDEFKCGAGLTKKGTLAPIPDKREECASMVSETGGQRD